MELPLASRIQELFSSSDQLLVTLLLDSSGSVSSDYPVLKELCLSLIEKLVGVTIQIIQFSHVAKTEVPFTQDQVKLKTSLNGTLQFFFPTFV